MLEEEIANLEVQVGVLGGVTESEHPPQRHFPMATIICSALMAYIERAPQRNDPLGEINALFQPALQIRYAVPVLHVGRCSFNGQPFLEHARHVVARQHVGALAQGEGDAGKHVIDILVRVPARQEAHVNPLEYAQVNQEAEEREDTSTFVPLVQMQEQHGRELFAVAEILVHDDFSNTLEYGVVALLLVI